MKLGMGDLSRRRITNTHTHTHVGYERQTEVANRADVKFWGYISHM